PAIAGATLSSDGLFTPPVTATTASSTTVTAASTDDSTVLATMVLWVFPNSGIFLRPGATSNFTDSLGNVWIDTGGDSGWIGCCGNLSYPSSWPSVPNIAEYYFEQFAPGGSGDIRVDAYVQNGTYKITVKLGTDQPPGRDVEDLEAQGVLYYSNVDVNVAAGGKYLPVDYVLANIPVTDGQLSFVLRAVNGNGVDTINALQITQTSNGVPVAPASAGGTVK
ncbi:MAG: hypothetical protein ACRD4Y_14400, partial [Candidatus Acidiferrales bacterium]